MPGGKIINFAECLLTALDDQEVLEYAPYL